MRGRNGVVGERRSRTSKQVWLRARGRASFRARCPIFPICGGRRRLCSADENPRDRRDRKGRKPTRQTTGPARQSSSRPRARSLRGPPSCAMRRSSSPRGICSTWNPLAAAVRDVDAVVHCAAFFRGATPEQAHAVNDVGTQHLAHAARAARVRRFVFTSTGLVYGSNGGRLAREDDPCAPTAAYPVSKLAAERFLLAVEGLDVRVLRLPFVYGDGDAHIAEAIPMMRSFPRPTHVDRPPRRRRASRRSRARHPRARAPHLQRGRRRGARPGHAVRRPARRRRTVRIPRRARFRRAPRRPPHPRRSRLQSQFPRLADGLAAGA